MANRVTQEYSLLRPFVVAEINNIVNRRASGGGGGSGSGGGGGAPSPHALNSGHHSGTLADAQAPQFAMLDGSRTYTGNIAFSGSQTVDGVDISVHAADADAHHLRVAAGDGISVNVGTQTVSVNQAFSFAWTADHTHAGNLQFVGTRTVSSSGSNHLNVAPGGDLVLNSTKTWRSSDYADGIPIAGFSNHINSAGNRQLTINTIKADELHVRLFVADTVRVDVGEEYWGKSMGIVYENFTTPGSIGGTVTIKVEDSPAFSGALFSNNDWVLIRIIDDSGGGLVVASIWGQVSSYSNLGQDAEGRGRQSWTFTLRQGPTNQPVKAGNVVVSFGSSGQGYVHLSTLQSADGPWIQIGTWAGANPYTPGNRTPRTQIGRLTNISDADLNPTGYGLYSENAYLKGVMRTAQTIMDDDGIKMLQATSLLEPGNDSNITWWPDINDTSGVPAFVLASWVYSGNAPNYNDVVTAKAFKRSASDYVIMDIGAINNASNRATLLLDSRNVAELRTGSTGSPGNFTVQANLLPHADNAVTLGSASFRWNTLYANQIIATTVSGTTMAGAEWEYTGNMVIDANSGSNTTVSVTNQGAGQADLNVQRNIIVGGTVDGVDISVHAANADAHHNQSHVLATTSALGGDHTVSGLTSGQVLRATGATTAAFGVLNHSQLGSVTADQHHNQVHVLATNSGLGADHTMSGATAGHVLRASSATAAAFAQLQHNDLGGVTADQHHNQAHVLATNSGLGADHSMSGATAGHVLRASGATAAAFAQLQHNDLGGVTANQHHNQVHDVVGSDHTLTGSQYQLVGATATNTIGLLTPSVDVGTTPAAAILRSTAGGGLTLATLQVRGAVDIVNNGNLTVGGGSYPTLYAFNTGDPSTARVGINRIPDPQFSLDVSGPLRADYLIGKLARTLKDARMICQYDGGFPLETNYTGQADGHFGQIGTYAGGVIWRKGIFQKAVQIARAETNLQGNPSIETNTTGFASLNSGTISQSTEDSYVGLNSLKTVTAAATVNSGVTYTRTSILTASTAYTLSFYIKGDSKAQNLRLEVRNNGNSANLASANFVLAPTDGDDQGWRLVVLPFTTDAGQTNLIWRIYNQGGTTSCTFYIDAIQVELATATPYIDGSLIKTNSAAADTGHSWAGTAHASSSSRTAGSLFYDDEVFPLERGTIIGWYRLPWGTQVTSRAAASYFWGLDANNSLRINTGGTLILRLGGVDIASGGSGISDSEWHFVAATWDIYSGDCAVYVDGAAKGTGTGATTFTPSGTTLYVGSRNAGNDAIDGWIDCFATVDRALPASEILSIYETTAPIFAENSVFAFRATPRGLVWADEYGLWMKDIDGDPVLGAYGGEPSTYSWGGKTLGRGDILFGRYGSGKGGWMHWDRDGDTTAALMTIGYADRDVLLFSGSAAKLQKANLEIMNGTDEIMGVFATTPPASWAGISAVAVGDVVIGDSSRGAVTWWDDSTGEIKVGRTGASNTYLSLTGTSMTLLHNNVTRMFLDSTGFYLRDSAGQNRIVLGSGGALNIMNSSSQNVFTFDSSAGAEFTLPLTLGTNGGIYQGSSGSFASPGTGLKIWNDSSVGRIAGFNGGTLQWGAGTDGELAFGGGNGKLSQYGLDLLRGGGTFDTSNSVAWWNSFANRTQDILDTDLFGIITVNSASGMIVQSNNSNPLRLQATHGGSDASVIVLDANSGGTNTIDVITEALNITAPVSVTGSLSASANLTAGDDLFVTDKAMIGFTSIARTLPAQANVQIEGTTTGTSMAVWQNTNDANGPLMVLGKTRSTSAGGNNTVNQNDRLGSIQFWGGDGGSTTATMAAEIYVTVAGTAGNNDMPGQLHISTTPDGSSSASVRLRVTQEGLVGVNTQPVAGQFETVSGDNGRVAAIVNSAASPSVDILRVLRNGVSRVTVDSAGDLVLNNTDVTTGPKLFLQSVKSGSGAAFDACGILRGMARNSASVDKVFGDIVFQIDVATAGSERGGIYLNTQHGGDDAIPFAAVGANVRMCSGSLTAVNFQGAEGIIFIQNVTTTPSANPSSGHFLYAESGALKGRGSSGTITTIANADPHCPVCGADYMKEFDNQEYGYFSMCLKCLADELGERPWIIRGPSKMAA